MVHLGTITNAKGEDVTTLVRNGQYELGERAVQFLKRTVLAPRKACKDSTEISGLDTQSAA